MKVLNTRIVISVFISFLLLSIVEAFQDLGGGLSSASPVSMEVQSNIIMIESDVNFPRSVKFKQVYVRFFKLTVYYM